MLPPTAARSIKLMTVELPGIYYMIRVVTINSIHFPPSSNMVMPVGNNGKVYSFDNI